MEGGSLFLSHLGDVHPQPAVDPRALDAQARAQVHGRPVRHSRAAVGALVVPRAAADGEQVVVHVQVHRVAIGATVVLAAPVADDVRPLSEENEEIADNSDDEFSIKSEKNNIHP